MPSMYRPQDDVSSADSSDGDYHDPILWTNVPSHLPLPLAVHTLQVNSKYMRSKRRGALSDSGANGCVVGNNVSIPWPTDRYIDMSGIKDHTVNNLNIVHAAFVRPAMRS